MLKGLLKVTLWLTIVCVARMGWAQPATSRGPTIPFQQRSELLNGLRVVVVERQNQSTATALLVTFAGASADDSGKAGTATLTAKMLLAATPQRKSAQITEDITAEGLTATARADYDASWIRFSGPAQSVNTMLEELGDLVLHSNFDEKELSQLKEQSRNEMLARRSDASTLAALHFREKLFGMHPFGFPPEGVPRTINEVSGADCVRFYQRFYHPNNALLLVVGGVRADDVVPRVRVLLGGWRNIPAPPILPRPTKQPVGVLIRIVDRATSDPAQIRLGRIGVHRTSRDFYNLEILNFVLGGEGFASRFAERLQKRDHLTTDVSSAFEFHLGGGDWMARLSTPSSNAAPAVAALLDEIKKIRDTKPADKDLNDAVSTMAARLTAQLTSNDQIAEAFANIEIYNLAFDALTAYVSHLSLVTPEQVQQTARAYLDPDSLVVVIVGSAAEMKESLQKIGIVEVFPGN
jgi:zinc protease